MRKRALALLLSGLVAGGCSGPVTGSMPGGFRVLAKSGTSRITGHGQVTYDGARTRFDFHGRVGHERAAQVHVLNLKTGRQFHSATVSSIAVIPRQLHIDTLITGTLPGGGSYPLTAFDGAPYGSPDRWHFVASDAGGALLFIAEGDVQKGDIALTL